MNTKHTIYFEVLRNFVEFFEKNNNQPEIRERYEIDTRYERFETMEIGTNLIPFYGAQATLHQTRKCQ